MLLSRSPALRPLFLGPPTAPGAPFLRQSEDLQAGRPRNNAFLGRCWARTEAVRGPQPSVPGGWGREGTRARLNPETHPGPNPRPSRLLQRTLESCLHTHKTYVLPSDTVGSPASLNPNKLFPTSSPQTLTNTQFPPEPSSAGRPGAPKCPSPAPPWAQHTGDEIKVEIQFNQLPLYRVTAAGEPFHCRERSEQLWEQCPFCPLARCTCSLGTWG